MSSFINRIFGKDKNKPKSPSPPTPSESGASPTSATPASAPSENKTSAAKRDSMFNGLNFRPDSMPKDSSSSTNATSSPNAGNISLGGNDSGGGLDMFSGLMLSNEASTSDSGSAFSFVATSPSTEANPPETNSTSNDPTSNEASSLHVPSNSGFSFMTPNSGPQASPTDPAPLSSTSSTASADNKSNENSESQTGNAGMLDFSGLSIKQPDDPVVSLNSGDSTANSTGGMSMFGGLNLSSSSSSSPSSDNADSSVSTAVATCSVQDEIKDDQDAATTNANEPSQKASTASVQETPIEKPMDTSTKGQALTLLDHLGNTFTTFWTKLKEFNEEQASLKQDEVKFATIYRACILKLQKAEQDQVEAIAQEAYEQADHLNMLIDSAKVEMKQANENSKAAQKDADQLEIDRESFIASYLSGLDTTCEELIVVQEVQQEELEEFSSSQSSLIEQREDALNAEMDRNTRTLNHVLTDLKDSEEEKKRIEDNMAEDTAGLIEEKQDLIKQETKLNQELEELLRQVEAKKDEISLLQQSKQVSDANMAKARQGHERKLKRVADRKEQILAEQKEATKEQQALQAQRDVLDQDISTMQGKVAEMKDLLKCVHNSVKNFKRITRRLDKEKLKCKRRMASIDAKRVDVEQMIAELSDSEAKIESLREEVLGHETAAAENHQTVQSVNMRVPGLEAEKKLAVTARNFKSAGALSKEIKSLNQSKEEAEQALDELASKVSACNTNLAKEQENKTAIEKRMAEAQTEVEVLRVKLLIKRKRDISKLLKRLEDSSPYSWQEAEQDALLAESKNCDDEIKQIIEKNGWMDDHIRASESEDDDDDNDDDEDEEQDHDDGKRLEGDNESEDNNNEAATIENDPDADVETDLTPSSLPSSLASGENDEQGGFDANAKLRDRKEKKAEIDKLEGALQQAQEVEDYELCEELHEKAIALASEVESIDVELAAHGIDPNTPEADDDNDNGNDDNGMEADEGSEEKGEGAETVGENDINNDNDNGNVDVEVEAVDEEQGGSRTTNIDHDCDDDDDNDDAQEEDSKALECGDGDDGNDLDQL